MILNQKIEQAKNHYENLLEFHIRKGAIVLEDLSFNYRKEVALAYLKTLARNEQEEVMNESYAQILCKIPKLMMNIMEHNNEEIDTHSELINLWISAIIDEVSFSVDSKMDKIEELIKYNAIENAQMARDERRIELEILNLSGI